MAQILLVDDDRDIRELGRALLSHAGHNVRVADGAMPALALLRQEPVDMLVTDANMPNYSGFDLLKLVQREFSPVDFLIVMLTGRRERADVEAAAGVGVNAYIVKPLDPVLFTDRVNELLAKRPARDPIEGDFSSIFVAAEAKVHLEYKITAISPLGLMIESSQPMRVGSKTVIESKLFETIDIGAQKTHVFSCTENDDGYEIRLSFADVSDQNVKQIRGWINAQSRSRRKRAA